ncbi:MAG: ATP-dependent Clp protease adaptor ClpS [Spirochaetales bacterium]|nr:ATP-dependent Clp protease adaptor ClpS [Spirochaetales bacterium]
MSEFEYQDSLQLEDETKEPPKYKVILINDDYSTFEFVTYILKKVFFKTQKDAEQITLDVHKKGFGVCGIYDKEIAETKVLVVHQLAEEAGYPLRCEMEEE